MNFQRHALDACSWQSGNLRKSEQMRLTCEPRFLHSGRLAELTTTRRQMGRIDVRVRQTSYCFRFAKLPADSHAILTQRQDYVASDQRCYRCSIRQQIVNVMYSQHNRCAWRVGTDSSLFGTTDPKQSEASVVYWFRMRAVPIRSVSRIEANSEFDLEVNLWVLLKVGHAVRY